MWPNRIKDRTTARAADLLDHAGNWRVHPEAQKAGMVGVLDEVGIVDALTVYHSEKRGGLVIIDGHLRKSIDPEQEWPIDLLDVSDEEADYILATKDPLAAAASANRERLGALLQNVQSGNEGVQSLLAGLAEREGVFFGNGDEPPEDPGAQIDRASELQEVWKVETGDLWVIPSNTASGEHRVVCGDCTDGAVVERVMGGELAGAVVTDPPYGLGESKSFNDDHPDYEDDEPFNLKLIDLSMPFVVWGGQYYDWLPMSRNKIGWIVWDKRPNLEGEKRERADRIFGQHFEIAISDIGDLRGRTYRQRWGGYYGSQEIFHKTQKPPELFEWCIAPTNGIIIDYFCGSGTTLVACERLGRLGRGVEIEPKYVAVTLERLAGMGLEPRRVT